MEIRLRLSDIRSLLGEGLKEEGAYDGALEGIASLEEARAGDLSFCTGERYRAAMEASDASVVLLPATMERGAAKAPLLMRVEHPSVALARICSLVESRLWPAAEPGIHPTTAVDPSAEVSAEATVGPFCWIGPEARIGPCSHLVSHVSVGRRARIGAECRLAPQVVIGDFCEVGDRCRLHGGVVIGSDGFGYEPVDQSLMKLPQVGNVVLEADVEIGALCSVDRARFSETHIGEGTKIDNMVHLAHNVRVGARSAIAAQVGVSGSSRIGSKVLIYGQAGVAGHLTIGDGAVVAGGSHVTKNVKSGQVVRGMPIMELNAYNRLAALQRKLPDFVKRIEKVEQILEDLKEMTDETSEEPKAKL